MSGSLPISGVVLTPRSMEGRPSAMICQATVTKRACLSSVRPMGSGTDQKQLEWAWSLGPWGLTWSLGSQGQISGGQTGSLGSWGPGWWCWTKLDAWV